MDNTLNYLVTLSNGEYLIKCALKLKPNMLTGDAEKYPLEPENKLQFAKLLPQHASSFGAIVEVEEIFDLCDKTK